ncbi:MAG TPA: DUF2092 domain-containing protein, partial [Planctomycetota bacterium]|nr:DUF2092 domain-containing protein [Planctomycetota bacterium]
MIPLLLALPFLIQDEEAAARKILEASAMTLRKAAALSFEAEITQNSARPGTPPAPRVSRFILRRPNLLRIETAGQFDSTELISDGRLLTFLRKDGPAKSEYTQYALGDPQAASYLPRDPVLAICFGPDFIGEFHGADELRASREQIEGQDCDVVSGTLRMADASDLKRTKSFRLWLGRDRLPRKFTLTTETEKSVSIHTAVYSKFDLEAKPDDGAFTFKPPEGAKQLNRKANQPDDLPKTAAAQKAQEILIAVHKALRGFESVRYERAGDRVTLRRPLQLRIDSGESGSGYSYIVDGASRFHVEESR